MPDVRERIKKNGWLQGKVLRDEDLIELTAEENSESVTRVGVVVTQSCDLTHASLEAEPYAELILGFMTERANDRGWRGNFTHGKSARRLCLEVQSDAGDSTWYEFSCHDMIRICRSELTKRQPDSDHFLLDGDTRILTYWLGQRYRRAALPDDFNNLLRPAANKIKQIHKSLSPHISAIYYNLEPDRDLENGESYLINLLATIPEDRLEHLESAQEPFLSLVAKIEEADIDVNARLRSEKEVSIHAVRRMKRFPLDHFSLAGEGHPFQIDE